jgi:signal transduction histidine kinase
MKTEISREFEVFKNVIIKQTAAALEEPLLKAVSSGMDEFGEWLDRAVEALGARVKGLKEENDTLRALIGLGDTDVRAKILEQAAELTFLREQLLKLKSGLTSSDGTNDDLRLEVEKLRQELAKKQAQREDENSKHGAELAKLLEKLAALEKKISVQQEEIENEKAKLSAANAVSVEASRRALEVRSREEIKLLGARLRNLGNPIAGSAKFCLDKLENIRNAPKNKNNEEALLELAPDLDMILKNSQEITQVLDSYMKLYEEPKLTLENIDFTKVWDALNVKFASQFVRSGVKVRMPQEKKYPLFVSDKKMLQEITETLMVNALEALPKGGKLEITGKFGEEAVELIFTDDGPGLKPDNLSKLFLPFFTTKPGHWGMGLVKALKMAKSLGGNLEYAPPAAGPGCVFTFTAPTLKGKA